MKCSGPIGPIILGIEAPLVEEKCVLNTGVIEVANYSYNS